MYLYGHRRAHAYVYNDISYVSYIVDARGGGQNKRLPSRVLYRRVASWHHTYTIYNMLKSSKKKTRVFSYSIIKLYCSTYK